MKRHREPAGESYVATLARARAERAQKGARADHARRVLPQSRSLRGGVALRWAEVRARIRTEHPAWPDEWVEREAVLALNKLGLYALTSPGAGSAPRPSFPMHRMHDHVMVGQAYEPEAEQRVWRVTVLSGGRGAAHPGKGADLGPRRSPAKVRPAKGLASSRGAKAKGRPRPPSKAARPSSRKRGR
jgi:hypothetical protein